MKIRKLIICSIFSLSCISVQAQNSYTGTDIANLQQRIENVETKNNQLGMELKASNQNVRSLTSAIDSLQEKYCALSQACDSLRIRTVELSKNQISDKKELSLNLLETHEDIRSTNDVLLTRTLWIVTIIMIIITVVGITIANIGKKVKRGSSSIDEIRKIQESLKESYIKIQEESAKLDNQMISLMEKQINIQQALTPTGTDHSLALKVAREIVRIELNLSRMDASVKGYKQLAKGVQRIKDNFKANDYEIVDMLGKQYQQV